MGVLGVLSSPFYLSEQSKHDAVTLMQALTRVVTPSVDGTEELSMKAPMSVSKLADLR